MIALSNTLISLGAGAVAAFFVVVIIILTGKRSPPTRTDLFATFTAQHGIEAHPGPELVSTVVPDTAFTLFRCDTMNRQITERMSRPGSGDSVFEFSATSGSADDHANQHQSRTCALIQLHFDAPLTRFSDAGFLAPPVTTKEQRLDGQSLDEVLSGNPKFDSTIKLSGDPEFVQQLLTPHLQTWLIEAKAAGWPIELELHGRWMLCNLGSGNSKLEHRMNWLDWATDLPAQFPIGHRRTEASA